MSPATVSADDDRDFTGLTLEELGAISIPSVVGASKHEQRITEAPSAVTIVSSEEIQRSGYRTLGEILRSVRGFYGTYDRGYHSIGYRGINQPGDYGGRMLVAINGHRLNDAIYDTAASGMDFLLDVDLIERVEVIRGPGMSLYGNNAFLGVINVVTRDPSDFRGGEIAVSGGAHDTYSGRFSYGNTLTNGVGILISGTWFDSGGNPRLRYAEFSETNGGVAEDMDGEWARSGFARLSWRGWSLEGGIVEREKTWPTAAYSTETALTIFNDPRFHTFDRRAYAVVGFRHTSEGAWEWVARGYFDHYQFRGQYPVDYFDPEQPLYLNLDDASWKALGGELQASKLLFEKHQFTAGAEFRYDLDLIQRNEDVLPPTVYSNSRESAFVTSGYVQDDFRVTKDLILNAGLRYDDFSTSGGTLNPRAALIYSPWRGGSLKALYGRAFRAPNAYEFYYVSSINKLNPGLDPETIRSYELVYEQQLSSHWRSTASVFYNDINGLIGYREDPDDHLFYFDNRTSVEVTGVEAELEGRWSHGLTGRLSYTFAHARDNEAGGRLPNSPEHVAQATVMAPLWHEKVFGQVQVQALSDRQTVRGGAVGAVALVHGTLLARELVPGLTFSISVYNILDRHFRDPAPPDFTQDSILQDGRTFRVKLTYRF